MSFCLYVTKEKYRKKRKKYRERVNFHLLPSVNGFHLSRNQGIGMSSLGMQ